MYPLGFLKARFSNGHNILQFDEHVAAMSFKSLNILRLSDNIYASVK